MERTNKTLKAEMEEMVEIIESFSHHILKRMDVSIFDLDKDDVDLIMKERTISKINKYTDDIKQISTERIEIVKCYVI